MSICAQNIILTLVQCGQLLVRYTLFIVVYEYILIYTYVGAFFVNVKLVLVGHYKLFFCGG